MAHSQEMTDELLQRIMQAKDMDAAKAVLTETGYVLTSEGDAGMEGGDGNEDTKGPVNPLEITGDGESQTTVSIVKDSIDAKGDLDNGDDSSAPSGKKSRNNFSMLRDKMAQQFS